jgi:hypothetical protein
MQKTHINNHLHLMVQFKIRKLLDKTDVFLEHYFKNHRADVYWQSEKIVFEVQCSPISLKEAKKRSKDFEDLNIHLVWILHQKTFNKIHMSPSEEYLVKNKTVFYTNISQNGEGIIFDQEHALCFDQRVVKSPPVEIDIASPLFTKYKKTLLFKNSINCLPLYRRVRSYPLIWRKKFEIGAFLLKQRGTFYYRYLKWKVKLS